MIIIKHLDNTISTDDDLFQTINRIKCEIGDIKYYHAGIHTLEQAILYIAQISAVYVGEALLKQNALLLPDVYESFLEKLLDTIQSCRINVDQDLLFSSKSELAQKPTVITTRTSYGLPMHSKEVWYTLVSLWW